MVVSAPESDSPAKSRQTARSRLILAGAFFLLLLLYASWMTGFTFRFSECGIWPNYNMLARAFAKGQLHLDETGLEDYSIVNGKAYLYSGPVPAILRLPVVLVYPKGIPTGLMIAAFVAGTCLMFALISALLVQEDHRPSDRLIQAVFTTFMVCNGLSLFVVTIPSFHHEAIACGMFFLSAALYCFFKVRATAYRPSPSTALLLGCCFVLCLGTRLSYALSIGFLGVLTAIGMFRALREGGKREVITAAVIIGGVTVAGVALLLAYNRARYGSFLESGMQYQASLVFGDYFRKGYYFRYDHIPHNIWSFFFRLPNLTLTFPFIALPAYIMKMESIQFLPYYLINGNELSVSVFVLMPLLLLAVYPVAARLSARKEPFMGSYGIVMAVFALQVIPVAATVATTARYYYDFFPILAMGALLGALQVSRLGRFLPYLIVALGVTSVVLSFTLPVHGVVFYNRLINYHSPLIDLLPR